MNPKKIDRALTWNLRNAAVLFNIQPYGGYRIFVTDCIRGWCRYDHKYLTVPARTFDQERFSKLYPLYYLAHECAHSHAFENTGECQHGGTFMEEFMRLCPKELQHFELDYKPKLAKAAGIKP